MNPEQSKVQVAEQAGSPGKAAGVGLEVGVPHSSEETPITGAEPRRGTCLGVSRGTWPRASREDTPRGRKVPNADSGCGGNAAAEQDLESRIREIRPSGLMRGRYWLARTDNYGRFNLMRPAPAYSTQQPAKGAQLVGASPTRRIRRFTTERPGACPAARLEGIEQSWQRTDGPK